MIGDWRSSAPSSLFGVPVYFSPFVKHGDGIVAFDGAYDGRKSIAVHCWIDAKMLTFDHDLWWSETPKQTARRIANEVLEHHGFETLPSLSEDGDA